MLQRVQTIFLLIVAGLMVAMYFMPVVSTFSKPEIYFIVPYCTVSLTLLTALITIFLYNNRKLQIKLDITIIVFLLLTYAETFLIMYLKTGIIPSYFPLIGAILPILGIIFTVLATRAIKKDENLVRSTNRIR